MGIVIKEFSDFIVSYNDSPEMREKVFTKVMEWIFKHEAFLGEAVQQNDNCIIDSVELVSDIVDDIIKFDWQSKD